MKLNQKHIEEKSFSKTIQIKQKFDLCVIWRIRNPSTMCYTLCQQHISGYIQRKFDYFFISNVFQKSVKNPDILTAFSTDHSLLTFPLSSKSEGTRLEGLWKQNNSF